MIRSSYEIGFKYDKENVQGREFQESHKSFSANFKRKIVRIESHEVSKIKVFRDVNVAKCFKRGEIFVNNALNCTKILQLLTTNLENTQAVYKVECLQYKKEPYLHFHFSKNKLFREEKITKVASRESRNYVPRLFFLENILSLNKHLS